MELFKDFRAQTKGVLYHLVFLVASICFLVAFWFLYLLAHAGLIEILAKASFASN